jgi:MFS family permease
MRLRSIFALLCWEGAFAMAFDTWIGAAYLSGLGGELGVSVGMVSFLVSVPWIGAIGQIFGFWALERVSSMKSYTLWIATAARALWTIPLLFAGYWLWRSSTLEIPFPRDSWMLLLTAVACTSALLATSSTAAWSSWTQELVPSHMRGRFFGIRQRYTVCAAIVANGLGALFVGWRPEGLFLGYSVLAALAVLAGLLSVYLLAKVPDASRRVYLQSQRRRRYSLASILAPLENQAFRRVLIFGALFNGVVQLTGPFFPYYFTKELGLPMSSIAFWTVMTQIGAFASAGIWGRKIDQSPNPARLILISANIIALSPLIYSFRGIESIKIFAPMDYTISGVAWTGYTLAFTTLLFRVCPPKNGAICFSLYAAAAGLAGACGNLAGGALAQAFQSLQDAPGSGFRSLFFLGGVTRFALVWGLYGLIRPVPMVSRDSALSELEISATQPGSEDGVQTAG